jgi:hypothetical protein
MFTPQQVPFSGAKSVASLLVLNNASDIIAKAELRGEGGAGRLLFLRGYFFIYYLLFYFIYFYYFI